MGALSRRQEAWGAWPPGGMGQWKPRSWCLIPAEMGVSAVFFLAGFPVSVREDGESMSLAPGPGAS